MVRSVAARIRRRVLDERDAPTVAAVGGHPGGDGVESGGVGRNVWVCRSEKLKSSHVRGTLRHQVWSRGVIGALREFDLLWVLQTTSRLMAFQSTKFWACRNVSCKCV
jgi:hypothetical protein